MSLVIAIPVAEVRTALLLLRTSFSCRLLIRCHAPHLVYITLFLALPNYKLVYGSSPESVRMRQTTLKHPWLGNEVFFAGSCNVVIAFAMQVFAHIIVGLWLLSPTPPRDDPTLFWNLIFFLLFFFWNNCQVLQLLCCKLVRLFLVSYLFLNFFSLCGAAILSVCCCSIVA